MIYVDNPQHQLGRMKMCHMISDDNLDELFEMADKIGVNRKWFQGKASFPHFDICLSKRKLAIDNGAKEASSRHEYVDAMKRFREKNK